MSDLDQRIAALEALDKKRTQGDVWKWMGAGVLDNTNRLYIYAGSGEYGKYYHATTGNSADAAFISAAPEMMSVIRELKAELQAFKEIAQAAGRAAHGYTQEIAALKAERDALASENERMVILELRAELDEAYALLKRYRNETPLGHQPHMIAQRVDEILKP